MRGIHVDTQSKIQVDLKMFEIHVFHLTRISVQLLDEVIIPLFAAAGVEQSCAFVISSLRMIKNSIEK